MTSEQQKLVTIFHGPQHPGITGNMSVELDLEGETIKRAQTHVGYLHRGFEKLVERRTVVQAFTIVCRICVPEPDPMEENFARSVEGLAGLKISEKASLLRTMVLEMSRVAGFFMQMGGQAGSIGLPLIPEVSIGDRDFMLDRFEELTGGRVYHMYAFPGGVRRDAPEGFLGRLSDLLDYYEGRMDYYNRVFFDNALVKTRLIGHGVVTAEDAIKNGYVGQVLRAAGIKSDVRKDMPYLSYAELDFDIPTETSGDAYARALVRREEFYQAVKILRQIIKRLPTAEGDILQKIPKHRKFTLPKDDIYVQTETSRGAMSFYMAGDGTENIRRMQVRGPSLVHGFPLLEKILVESELSDVSMIMNSLGICPPEMER